MQFKEKEDPLHVLGRLNLESLSQKAADIKILHVQVGIRQTHGRGIC